MTDEDLDGRVVVVTGATRGIGRAIALYLARRGVRLAVTGRKQQRLDDLRSELAALGEEPVAQAVNAADREGTFTLVEEAADRFGRIDGLVANAQTFRPVTPLADVTGADMDTLMETGPKVTLWSMQAVFPHMRGRGWGRIVTMGSNGALLGSAGFGPYSASKEAIRGLTRVAAREWGKFGIVVNCVCPVSVAHRSPPTESERAAAFAATFADQPIARDGDAKTDIAPVVAFLLSDDCRYMTGQTIMADGGAIMLR
jgi:NAD(P)-dependent dehydrogenase (short-subunit alcohol dehydrogenase family)